MTTELATSVLLITHDRGLAAERASRVIVMHRGRVVEQGPARQILEAPQHPYTKSLVAAAPSVAAVRLRPEEFRAARLGIAGEDAPARTGAGTDNIVEIENLTKVYPARGRGERSEEHTSELQSLMRISYAVFCLKKKKNTTPTLPPLYYHQHHHTITSNQQ